MSNKYYNITSLHKDDLESIGYDTSNLDESDMNTLADKMADDYLEQLYWDSLSVLAGLMGIPKKEGYTAL